MQTRNSKKMSGARILIETLIEQGTKLVFGYPGGQVLDIYDELYRARRRIKHILTAHEQGAAHAADGYSRASGEVGVVIATSGPGATNLVTGIATAMLDSVPMVVVTGNVASYLVGKDSFQEINITGITMPITKHNYFVTDVNELADTIREAFKIAKSGRPGPVLIDIPKDIQTAVCNYTAEDVVEPFPSETPDDSDIDRAVELINAAKRPYIYIGGGAAGAELKDGIIELAEKIDGCVGCTLMGLSVMPDSYPRFLGMQGMHGRYASSMANKAADLIIGIGVRFSDRATGDPDKYAQKAKIIQLDADLSEIGKNVKVDIGLVGDIKYTFGEILKRCEKKEHPKWRRTVESLKSEGKRIYLEIEEKVGDKLTPKKILNTINSIKDEGAIIVTDVGQHQMWTAQHTEFFRPRRFLSSGGLGTMGYGLGAAIGANMATGDRAVLITGDGNFGMNLNELVTAVTYKVPVTVVIMNNRALGMVRQWQTLFFDKHYSNTELERNTDFVKVADAFGAKGRRVTDISEFFDAFSEAYKYKGPFVIDAVIDREELVLPMLPPGGSIDDIITTSDEE